MVTLEAILERNNLNQAWKRVAANKGSAGVDGMEVQDLLPHLLEHGPELVHSIKEGRYKPQPVLRVLIPKEEKGKFRPLGIPTAVDRLVQQAVQQKLSEEYETVFSGSSHGFRAHRLFIVQNCRGLFGVAYFIQIYCSLSRQFKLFVLFA